MDKEVSDPQSLEDGKFYWVSMGGESYSSRMVRDIVMEADAGCLRSTNRFYTSWQIGRFLGKGMRIYGPLKSPFDRFGNLMEGDDMLDYKEEKKEKKEKEESV